jgi:hypothetical protein
MPRTMSSAAIPPPVVFDLDVTESSRLRDAFMVANGSRKATPLITLSIVAQFIPAILRLYRHRGSDPIDWVMLALFFVLFCVMLSAFVAPRWWERLLLKPQIGTKITFDATGIEIDCGTASVKNGARHVAFTKIRSVRLMADALLIMGYFKPIVIIPKRALPDDGRHVMSFFEDRLIAKGMLRRAPVGRSTIVNTVS